MRGELGTVQLSTWTNFLFACVNCNSCKGSTPIVVANYFWPDVDNTLLAFVYHPGGLVDVSAVLTPPQQTKAKATIELVGLDRYPGNISPNKQPTAADLRWEHRRELWDCAKSALARLLANDTPELREQIVDTARLRGAFGIWYAVFLADQDMRTRLRTAFLGTATNCFDGLSLPIARPGGAI